MMAMFRMSFLSCIRRSISRKGAKAQRKHSFECARLPEGFEEHDAGGGREIQTPYIWIHHRDFQTMAPVSVQELLGKASCFRTKDQAVVLLKGPIGVESLGFGSEIYESSFRQRLVERFEVSVTRELYVRPVIKSSSAQR